MANVISVKFRTAPKSYYFDPGNDEYKVGEYVVVETIRGIEFGEVTVANRYVDDQDVVQPIKPVERRATERDIERNKENLESRKWLMEKAEEKVVECKLSMKISDAEYTFDRKKTIIYYTAEGRVDFRELVRKLASSIGGRIEMRQIYESEDLKMKGAVGICGRPCCCTTFLGSYSKASIKMAKNQGLALNPGSINGYCGKLMCCLRYEDDFYQEANKRMPKIKSRINTPDGEGVVVNCDVIKEKVTVRFFYDGLVSYKAYPLEEMDFARRFEQNDRQDKKTDEKRTERKDKSSEDIIDKDLADKDLIDEDLTDKDLIDKDLADEDIIAQQVFDEYISDQDNDFSDK